MKVKMQAKDDKCHHLYTMWAFEHIKTAVDCIIVLSRYANCNVDDIRWPLINALQKKIYTNPAYKEAFTVLCKMFPNIYLTFVQKELEEPNSELLELIENERVAE